MDFGPALGYAPAMRQDIFPTLIPPPRTILIPALLLAVLLAGSAPALARAPIAGRVLWVHDGDTVDVFATDLSVVRVRLYGVDCPESDQLHGLAATLFSAWNALFRTVEVRVMDRDRYGRTVGWIFVEGNGTSLNRMLVEQGHAWVYKQYCKARECESLRRAQDKARQERLGLWQAARPTPPWEWRRRGRGRW